MNRNLINNRSHHARRLLTAGVAVGIMGASVVGLAGCGGDMDNTPPAAVKQTGIFYGANTIPFTGTSGSTVLGRSFVELVNSNPVRVGFELTEAGREGQPPTAITDEGPNVYFAALPPEAAATCFKQLAVFYFTGHPVDQFRPVGEPEHFHTVFLLNAPQFPGPDFSRELKFPVAEEIPTGISRGIPDTVVPGVGVSYDNPVKPAGQPARITIGHNYLYYDAHMNGMVVGTNLANLRAGDTETDVIPQPAVYPRPGWYPGRWTIRFDSVKRVNIFEMTEFIYVGPEKSRKVIPN